jgi:hypothetical protein
MFICATIAPALPSRAQIIDYAFKSSNNIGNAKNSKTPRITQIAQIFEFICL